MAEAIAVIGTGSWGTMLTVMLARKGGRVSLWARTEEEAEQLRLERENRTFLPSVPLPASLTVTSSLEKALEGCTLLLLVVPAQRMRENLRKVRGCIPSGTVVVSAAKGLEIETTLRMSEVIAQELPSSFQGHIGALSGPNLVREIAAGRPATSVVACPRPEDARRAQAALMGPRFRVYTSEDLVGVELCGALKNIIAIGAGACDGLGYGNNAKAGFMTRGLAEISRLGIAAGANPLTFAGLAGIGDLIATCSSPHSRNHYVGEQLAAGHSREEIEVSLHPQVAEGISTTVAARKLAQKHSVEMPITEALYQVLFHSKDLRQAAEEFMLRDPKGELEGLEQWMRASSGPRG